MKYVARLLAEPPTLTAYCAANPTDAAASGAEARAAWDRFRDDEAYKKLRDELLARQQGLCGYCEQRLTKDDGTLSVLDQQVEHVRAKAGGVGRVLDWTNLMLCCVGTTRPHHKNLSRSPTGTNESCGQSKGSADLHPTCDPRTFPIDARLVDIGLDGAMRANHAACTAAGIDPKVLDETINQVLRLNCARLKLKRREVADNIREWVVPVLNNLMADAHLSPAQKQTFFMLMIAGRLQPDVHGHLRAFWTTERQYLEPSSNDWIHQNRPLLNA